MFDRIRRTALGGSIAKPGGGSTTQGEDNGIASGGALRSAVAGSWIPRFESMRSYGLGGIVAKAGTQSGSPRREESKLAAYFGSGAPNPRAPTPDDGHIDVVLTERVRLTFEHVFGRVVLQSREEGPRAEAMLKGLMPGSVLVRVNGETLSVENYSTVMSIVAAWVDVPDGCLGPPPQWPSAMSPVPSGLVTKHQQQQQQQHQQQLTPRSLEHAVDLDDEQDEEGDEEEDEEDGDEEGFGQSTGMSPAAAVEKPAEEGEEVEQDEDVVAPASEQSAGEVPAQDRLASGEQEDQTSHGEDGPTGGECGQTPESDRPEEVKDDDISDILPLLVLTFRLPAKDQGQEALLNAAEESFPLPQETPRRPLSRSEEEENNARRLKVFQFRERTGSTPEELPNRLAEHFLSAADWDVSEAEAQYTGVRDEARELLAASVSDEADISNSSLPPLVSSWDDDCDGEEHFPNFEANAADPTIPESPGASAPEYDVVIVEQQKLGVTVENVLERTVIWQVSRTSCAFRAGVEDGSLIVSLNEFNTKAMCHKEVIERLQQMHRPLKLRLRRVAPERLAQRRAEMHALLHPNGVEANDSGSLESRSQTVGWAETKLLGLVRLLVVASILEEQSAVQVDRPELWRERLLDVLVCMQAMVDKRKGRDVGVNERLRLMAQDLAALLATFEEFQWVHPVLARIRWPVIDLLAQVLCVDMDAQLVTLRESKELPEGPAIIMLRELSQRLRPSEVDTNVIPLLYRLAGSYAVHARLACCAVAPVIYRHLPQDKQVQVRGILTRFLAEDTPVMRAAVVETLSDLAEVMDQHAIRWLFFMLETTSKEGTHRVRTKVLEISYRIAKMLQAATQAYADNQEVLTELHLSRCKLLPFVNCCADDPDWQVRAAFAYFCPGFVNCFGEHWSTVFIDNLESLMRDPDVNVRRMAVDSIPKIAESWLPPPVVVSFEPPSPLSSSFEGDANTSILSSEWSSLDCSITATNKARVLDVLLPGFMRLVNDPSVDVRISIAAATGRLLKVLARLKGELCADVLDATVVQVMTPLMQRLLHDEAPNEVALALLEGMRVEERSLTGPTAAAAPYALLNSQVELLLPSIKHLASQTSWRLRKAVVECLPTFQVLVLPGHTYDDDMMELWDQLLKDGVENVRRTAGEYLCLAGRLVATQGGGGAGWVEARVLPQCRESLASSNFKQRQLGLHMAEVLMVYRCMDADALEREVVPVLVSATEDRLANVRIVAAMTIEAAVPSLPESIDRSQFQEPLNRLCDDRDRDVRHFARRAFEALGYGPVPLSDKDRA